MSPSAPLSVIIPTLDVAASLPVTVADEPRSQEGPRGLVDRAGEA